MNTIRQKFCVRLNISEEFIGNCPTLARARKLADEVGCDAIYLCADDDAGKHEHQLQMVRHPIHKWILVGADESDFANYERDASVERVDGPDGMRRINWTKEPNTVTVRPSEINEPATVHNITTKHVARVAVVDDALDVLNESISVVDGSLDDYSFDEIMELYIKLTDDLETQDDVSLDLASGDVRIICKSEIDTIWTDSLIDMIKECYELDSVPTFVVIDWDATAENCKVDGLGHHFNVYDGNEYDTTNHYIFRTN